MVDLHEPFHRQHWFEFLHADMHQPRCQIQIFEQLKLGGAFWVTRTISSEEIKVKTMDAQSHVLTFKPNALQVIISDFIWYLQVPSM